MKWSLTLQFIPTIFDWLLIPILALVAVLTTVLLFFFFKIRELLGAGNIFEVISKIREDVIKDHADKGGVTSAAKRGEKKLLGEMITGIIGHMTGGTSELVFGGLKQIAGVNLKGWLERNPYAVMRFIQNPEVIKVLKGFDLEAIMQQLQTGESPLQGRTQKPKVSVF